MLCVVRTGVAALLVSRWSLTDNGLDGTAVNVGGQAANVAGQGSDGAWCFVFDAAAQR